MIPLFVVELQWFDAVCAGELEDLGGPGDSRQVGAVADLSPITLELREKLFGPGYFVVRGRQTFVHHAALVRGQADLARHSELHGNGRGLDQLQSVGADRGPIDGAGQAGRLGGDRETRPGIRQSAGVFPETRVAAEVADTEGEPEGALRRGDLGDAL